MAAFGERVEQMERTRKERLSLLQLEKEVHHSESQDEVEDLEEIEKEKERYYSLQTGEMEEFRDQVENFLVECQVQVEELRSHVNELKTRFSELQGNLNHSNNSEIAAAEMRKKELLSIKENLEKSLALNYQLQEQLTKQLLRTLMDQSQEKK
ncbi:hypothetical protein RND71_021184 [Anisodus tanguticus]|uniref:Uncharacterized protein n=1 Tax=Anisodus tanguticus TaxID=243964 RepID=A0AAE1RVJ6_9SOLA|nr:hypothetical protein RND71_021184 [Anisodus tanguticus]